MNFSLEKLRSSELKATATESGRVKTAIMLWLTSRSKSRHLVRKKRSY